MQKTITVVGLVFSGVLYGFIFSVLLSQSTWLEMRTNVAVLIPAAVIAGAVIGLLMRKRPCSLFGVIIPEGVLLLILAILYGAEPEAMLVVPASLFREGFHLEVALKHVNLLLAAICIIGNLAWLCLSFITAGSCSTGRWKPETGD